MSGFVRDPDADALKQYLGKQNVEVGLLENAPSYEDGTSVVMVGIANEFGGSNLNNPPARHWLRKSVAADKSFYRDEIKSILKHKAGITRDHLFRALGRTAVDKIQGHLYSNDIGMDANEPSTKRAKGGDSPMIDSQHLVRESIDFRVNKSS